MIFLSPYHQPTRKFSNRPIILPSTKLAKRPSLNPIDLPNVTTTTRDHLRSSPTCLKSIRPQNKRSSKLYTNWQPKFFPSENITIEQSNNPHDIPIFEPSVSLSGIPSGSPSYVPNYLPTENLTENLSNTSDSEPSVSQYDISNKSPSVNKKLPSESLW